jgi:hypothetical protein
LAVLVAVQLSVVGSYLPPVPGIGGVGVPGGVGVGEPGGSLGVGGGKSLAVGVGVGDPDGPLWVMSVSVLLR